MTPPSSFVDSLKKQLPHLRIRWSRKGGVWHIEQKVARATQLRRYVSEWDDLAIRARDGYAFVMAVTNGDRIGCPRCGKTVHVPIMRMQSAHCPACSTQFRAVFYPLGDALLEHLRSTDPYRGGVERQMRELERHEQYVEDRKRRQVRSEVEDATKDLANRLLGIPQWGYTGKEMV